MFLRFLGLNWLIRFVWCRSNEKYFKSKISFSCRNSFYESKNDFRFLNVSADNSYKTSNFIVSWSKY